MNYSYLYDFMHGGNNWHDFLKSNDRKLCYNDYLSVKKGKKKKAININENVLGEIYKTANNIENKIKTKNFTNMNVLVNRLLQFLNMIFDKKRYNKIAKDIHTYISNMVLAINDTTGSYKRLYLVNEGKLKKLMIDLKQLANAMYSNI